MSTIANNLQQVCDAVKKAALNCGRDPASVKLVAVSKTVPPERIRQAVEAGATDLGENYIQEAREKIEALKDTAVTWHFIGHLQSNKAKYAVRLFELVHSVDDLSLAEELDRRARAMGKIQKVLVQVNVAGETTKSGVSPGDVLDLIRKMATLKNLAVCGLMTMPPYFNAPERVRPFFAKLRELRDQIGQAGIPSMSMTELSMGMSGDFKAAIEEGATLVRIGTAIFGERT
jgi:pyridoxal phosphate enzyme (YggS family)